MSSSIPMPGLRLTVGLLLLGAAGMLAGLLAFWVWQQGSAAGCGDFCDAVLKSKWARLGGIPVSVLGLASYLGLGLAVIRRNAWFFTFFAGLILFGALYFTALQGFIIRSWCPWCCVTHVLAVLASVFLATALPRSHWQHLLMPAACALACGVAFVALHYALRNQNPLLGRQFGIASAEDQSDLIRLHGGAFPLKESLFPVVRPLSELSRRPIVILSDYECAACRQLKMAVKDWTRRPVAPARLIFVPIARNEDARRLLVFLHAVRLQDPDLYLAIDALLASGELAPDLPTVKAYLEEEVGGEAALQSLLRQHSPKADTILTSAQALYDYNDTVIPAIKGVLPQILAGNRLFSGQFPSDDTLLSALEGANTSPASSAPAPFTPAAPFTRE
jgi:uncharacterized membrane protein